ncbi:SDR family oxidoreductase [Marinobacteraceae bacterium S3BR75-40.1]
MTDAEQPISWVTGSASGLGRALTGALLARGHRVVATDINMVGLERAAQADHWPVERCYLAPLDVRSAEQWQVLLGQVQSIWGLPRALFNSAGYLLPGHMLDSDDEQLDRHLDINLKGTMHGCRVLGRAMREAGQGQLINIASLAGVAPIPGIGFYSASKFAVRGFSLALAQELAPAGVQVSVVCPDAIETPMLKLQETWDEAALTFSGGQVLTTEQVTRALLRLLDKPRMEVLLPRSRGWLAKLGNCFPALQGYLAARLRRKGLAAQRARREMG